MTKKSKEEFLAEYTSKYIQLVPEYLRSHDDFLVFFALLCHEFNITEHNIQSFTDLVDPDKVPVQFIDSLGYFVNYHYQGRASVDFNRELLMRNRKLYEDRGTEKSIIMAATHGSNEGYLGGDIFIPGYHISKDIAELSLARDRIFIHSKSKLSSTSVYSDKDSFRPGIIVLTMPYLDSAIRAKLWEVIPAGIRLRYNIIISFIPNVQDPEDLYNFVPPWGVPKDDYNNLTYYPYIRVVPIVSKGDDFNSINNPTDFEYIINMSIEPRSDILVFSDGTLGRSNYFDRSGLYKPLYDEYGNIIYRVPLQHGRRLHSGRKTLMTDYAIESSLGVSALPLSLIRRPFTLSYLPDKYTVTEREVTVIVPNSNSGNNVSNVSNNVEETCTLEHSSELKRSKFSGNAFLGGNLEKEDIAPEQSYDNETHTETIRVKDYNFYRITKTGEYEDRIDKKTTDSVMRGFTVSMTLDYKSQKYHRVRHRSMRSGRYSGTLKSQSSKILRILLLDGVSSDGYSVSPFIELLNLSVQEYFYNKVTEMLNSILDVVVNEEALVQAEYDLRQCEILYETLRDSSLEKQEVYERMIELRNAMYSVNVFIKEGTQQYTSIKSEILETLFMEDGEVTDRGKEFLSITDYFIDNNYLLCGIFEAGNIFEYIPVMTMQPSDVLYPISEVLDKKPSDDKFGYLDTWNGSEETKKKYGLNPFGENRSPFFQYSDRERVYEPSKGGTIISMSPIVVGMDVERLSI